MALNLLPRASSSNTDTDFWQKWDGDTFRAANKDILHMGAYEPLRGDIPCLSGIVFGGRTAAFMPMNLAQVMAALAMGEAVASGIPRGEREGEAAYLAKARLHGAAVQEVPEIADIRAALATIPDGHNKSTGVGISVFVQSALLDAIQQFRRPHVKGRAPHEKVVGLVRFVGALRRHMASEGFQKAPRAAGTAASSAASAALGAFGGAAEVVVPVARAPVAPVVTTPVTPPAELAELAAARAELAAARAALEAAKAAQPVTPEAAPVAPPATPAVSPVVIGKGAATVGRK